MGNSKQSEDELSGNEVSMGNDKKELNELSAINRMGIISHGSIATVLAVSYLIEVLKGARTPGYYAVFMLLAIGPVLGELFFYFRKTDTDMVKHIIGFGYGIFYTFVLFTTTSSLAFTYVIPLFIVVTLYSDVRYCVLVTSACFFLNVIKVVMDIVRLGTENHPLSDYEIQIFLMLLVAIAICTSTSLLKRLNQKKMEELDQGKENVSNILNTVMGISGQMTEGIETVSKQMQELGDAVSETRNAMQEVSAGTNETAESVQSQLGKTEDIQKHIEQMAGITENITYNMEQAKDNVEVGKNTINSLLAQVTASEHAGKETVEGMRALEEYTANMQTIIDMITSVASQTSLLALNASIEAARAGEAGRGFAVVATEISNLASQTQSATVNITDVIQNVSAKLKIAVDAVGELMDNNKKQNEAAMQAAESFEKIAESTKQVAKQSQELDGAVAELAGANSGIVESIQTISAIMEEVSAHSQETYSVSERNANIVADVNTLIDDLNAKAKQLKQKDR